MHVPSLGGVYVIGPFPKRVNFASQQMRAFNLAWALTDGNGPVKADSKVAVIGAGLAGLTFAAALHRKGIEVQVFEQSKHLMPLQRNTTSRYVNPTLNYWPQVPLSPSTNLPFLNWSADVCERVIASVEAEWLRDFGEVSVHTKHKILHIHPQNNQFTLAIEGGAFEKGFTTVVVAVGFGLETPVKGALVDSYWDNVDTRSVNSSAHGDFVLSGSGDGGLLETLRLAYGGFEQGQLTSKVSRWANRTPVRVAIELAEHAAAVSLASPRERASALAMAYQTMDLDPELVAFLDKKLEGGSKVTLISRTGYPFTLESAPVHRLMLAHAIRRHRVDVGDGSFAVDAHGTATRVDDKGTILETYAGRPFVVRHGPAGLLRDLIGESEFNELQPAQSVLSPYQFRPLWPRGYFDRPGATSEEEQDAMFQSLKALQASLMREYPGLMYVQLAKPGAELICQFIIDRDDKAFREDEVPEHILGLKVEVQRRGWSIPQAREVAAAFERGNGPPKRPLRQGDRVRTSSARRPQAGSGVIGCFIQRRDEVAFALTAGHVLGQEVGTEVYASGPEIEAWQYVGTVARHTFDNREDVAAIKLSESVAFDVPTEDGASQITTTLGILGETVYRQGTDGRRIEATVTALATGVRIKVGGHEKVLSEAVVVSGGKTVFAERGDSGSIVRRKNHSIVGVIVAANDQDVFIGPIKGAVDAVGGHVAEVGRPGAALITQPAAPRKVVEIFDDEAAVVASKRALAPLFPPAEPDRVRLQLRDFVRRSSGRHSARDSLSLRAGDSRSVLSVGHVLYRIPDAKTLHAVLRETEGGKSVARARTEFLDFAREERFAERRLFYVPFFAGISASLWRGYTADLDHRIAFKWERPPHSFAEHRLPRGINREYDGVVKGRPVSLPTAVLTVDFIAAVAEAQYDYPFDSGDLAQGKFDVRGLPSPYVPTEFYSDTIDPAIYSLEAWQSPLPDPLPRSRDLHLEISRDLGRAWAPLLSEMLRGHLVTLGTAIIIRAFLQSVGVDLGSVRPARPSELRRARAAYSEAAVRRTVRNASLEDE